MNAQSRYWLTPKILILYIPYLQLCTLSKLTIITYNQAQHNTKRVQYNANPSNVFDGTSVHSLVQTNHICNIQYGRFARGNKVIVMCVGVGFTSVYMVKPTKKNPKHVIFFTWTPCISSFKVCSLHYMPVYQIMPLYQIYVLVFFELRIINWLHWGFIN